MLLSENKYLYFGAATYLFIDKVVGIKLNCAPLFLVAFHIRECFGSVQSENESRLEL